MEDYAEYTRIGLYQITETLDGTEIRVLTGRFGFIKTFKNPKDAQLERIKKFCEHNRFIEVIDNVPEDRFFSATFRKEP